MDPKNRIIIALGATYFLLFKRIYDKLAWQYPEHKTQQELYEIAASKGIDPESVANGIVFCAKQEGVTLSKARVLAELGKIVEEAKEHACLHGGDREMVDFMSLDEQQFALLNSMERCQFAPYNLGWRAETQAEIVEAMHPQQIFELIQLLNHQAQKLRNCSEIPLGPEHKWDVENDEPYRPYDPSELPPRIRNKPPTDSVPSMLEDNIWDYIQVFDWSDIDTIVSICF